MQTNKNEISQQHNLHNTKVIYKSEKKWRELKILKLNLNGNFLRTVWRDDVTVFFDTPPLNLEGVSTCTASDFFLLLKQMLLCDCWTGLHVMTSYSAIKGKLGFEPLVDHSIEMHQRFKLGNKGCNLRPLDIWRPAVSIVFVQVVLKKTHVVCSVVV